MTAAEKRDEAIEYSQSASNYYNQTLQNFNLCKTAVTNAGTSLAQSYLTQAQEYLNLANTAKTNASNSATEATKTYNTKKTNQETCLNECTKVVNRVIESDNLVNNYSRSDTIFNEYSNADVRFSYFNACGLVTYYNIRSIRLQSIYDSANNSIELANKYAKLANTDTCDNSIAKYTHSNFFYNNSNSRSLTEWASCINDLLTDAQARTRLAKEESNVMASYVNSFINTQNGNSTKSQKGLTIFTAEQFNSLVPRDGYVFLTNSYFKTGRKMIKGLAKNMDLKNTLLNYIIKNKLSGYTEATLVMGSSYLNCKLELYFKDINGKTIKFNNDYGLFINPDYTSAMKKIDNHMEKLKTLNGISNIKYRKIHIHDDTDSYWSYHASNDHIYLNYELDSSEKKPFITKSEFGSAGAKKSHGINAYLNTLSNTEVSCFDGTNINNTTLGKLDSGVYIIKPKDRRTVEELMKGNHYLDSNYFFRVRWRLTKNYTIPSTYRDIDLGRYITNIPYRKTHFNLAALQQYNKGELEYEKRHRWRKTNMFRESLSSYAKRCMDYDADGIPYRIYKDGTTLPSKTHPYTGNVSDLIQSDFDYHAHHHKYYNPWQDNYINDFKQCVADTTTPLQLPIIYKLDHVEVKWTCI